MKIPEYVQIAWSTHKVEPKKSLEDAKKQFPLIESQEDILVLAGFIVHVSGECLGDWLGGLELLKKLKNNPLLKDRTDMKRFVAILELGNNSATSIEEFSSSDKARILSTTAAAVAALGGRKLADNYFQKAEVLIEGIEANDPAIKIVAANKKRAATIL
jgi:hypothetical protein